MVKKPPANAGDPGLIPGLEYPLEKEMATHSSIPAWKIPWTEEPSWLQAMVSQRVRLDLATKHSSYSKAGSQFRAYVEVLVSVSCSIFSDSLRPRGL